MLKEYSLDNVEHLKVHGRTNGRLNPLTLFWTASGFEVNVTGAELWMEVEGDYKLQEPWISTRVNGAWVSRQMVNRGRQWICLFRGRNPEAVKNVRLMKDMQAMSGDPDHLLQIHALRTDGRFLPVREKALRLEFIGDSITSGEGDIGAREEEDWVSMLFSAEHDYAVMTGDLMDAEIRILSQSGWGVLTSWDNDPNGAFPPCYGEVCGLLSGERNRGLGAHQPNDFTSWKPDAVIVNLGTNDCGAFSSPEWKDEASGRTFRQRRLEDGSFCPEDLRRFQLALKVFLRDLRQKNPQAYLLWVCGMLGNELCPAISEAVEEYRRETGDRRASFFELTDAKDLRGARNHPGLGAHELAARELTEKLKQLLGNH